MMLLNARSSLWLLFLLPMAASMPQPTPAPEGGLGNVNLDYRAIIIGGGDDGSTSSRSASQSQSSSSTPVVPPASESTTSSSSSSSSVTTPSSTSTVPPSTTSQPLSTVSRTLITNDAGEVVTQTVIVQLPSSSSATPSPTAADNSSSGPGTGTFIGVGVAGGIAALGLIAFIVWKFNQKRFSQLDDDGGDINWPMPKEAELQAPAAPSMMGGTNATSSSIDLTNDPYAVPPLPQRNNTMAYHDDPSGSGVFYDPYRGPIPQTFTSPPQSTEGHNAYARGEAIPMNTYPSSSGRQSPGPNAAYDDPYARSGSPGPAAAYGDPYGARSRSPGPAMAYEDPYAGRRSPGPAMAYGGGGGVANPYDPSIRMGTPVGRVGTPGGGYGGAPPPGLDMMRTGTPQGYRGPSPAPPPPPGGAAYGIQQTQDPYGRYTPNPYGQ